MRRAQTLRLNEVGIATVAQLAESTEAERPVRVGAHAFRRLYIQGVSNSGDAPASLRYMRLQASPGPSP